MIGDISRPKAEIMQALGGDDTLIAGSAAADRVRQYARAFKGRIDRCGWWREAASATVMFGQKEQKLQYFDELRRDSPQARARVATTPPSPGGGGRGGGKGGREHDHADDDDYDHDDDDDGNDNTIQYNNNII